MQSKIKEIEKIEMFYKRSFGLCLVKYEHNEDLTWQEFLTKFFKKLNKNHYTIRDGYEDINLNEKGFNELLIKCDGWCLKNKNRSLSDIYCIVKNYYKNVSLWEVMGWLYENLCSRAFENVSKIYYPGNHLLGVIDCPNIKKRVFHNLNNYGCHDLKITQINPINRTRYEICDENGFYFSHYRTAYLKYKKKYNEQ